jgi:nitroreductase
MFEAARWAPSSYNSQPWRFLYAVRGTPHFDKFLGLLNEFNQSWAKTAGALVILVSKETMAVPGTDKIVPSRTHAFDAGAAWAYLALEASRLGFAAHGLAGVELDKIRTELKVPEGFTPEIGIAIGRPGDKTILPEALQAREAPSPRLPQKDIVFEGGFPAA